MKYPKYGAWCKQNVIETVRGQKIKETKKCLEKLIFNSDSELYENGVFDYDVPGILWIINGEPENLKNSLFSAVQHEFDEKYFQIAQIINPQMDMKAIRNDGGDSLKMLFATLENITMDELKCAVMYAFDCGTEEWKYEAILRIRREEWFITTRDNKKNTDKKAFPVYNQKLAGFLMMSGYRLMGIEENTKYKGKNVFYFMESVNIRKSIQAYFGNSR